MRHRLGLRTGGRGWLLLAGALIALALAAASCGGEEEAAPPPPPPAEPPPPPAEEPPAAAPPAEEPPAAAPPAEEPPAAAPPAEEPPAAAPPPAEEPPPAVTECPAEDGVINAFETHDVAGVIGPISNGHAIPATELWTKKVNDAGGILGCQVKVDYVDEPFKPDPTDCLRNFRNAIQSGDYDFIIGPVNSACMFALPDLTKAAGTFLFSGIAADHQPFFENYQKQGPYIAHGAVSTFLEGRVAAKWAVEQGLMTAAVMVPNYAYGQDVGKAFKAYYEELGGKVVVEQFPEFNEENFTPFINAMVAKKPDLVVSAFFGQFIIPFMKQWKAAGHDQEIPMISGIAFSSTFEALTEDAIPANTFGYDRGEWHATCATPTGRELCDLWQEARADSDFPIPGEFTFVLWSDLELMKALIETTGSLDKDAWLEKIESGTLSFNSPYNVKPTPVNPVNHMADTCVEVAQIVWNEDLPKYPASYDPATMYRQCMRDVIAPEDVRTLTDNPNATDEALQTYLDAQAQEDPSNPPVVETTWPLS